MISSIFLDCNYTLENFDSVKSETKNIISFVANKMSQKNIIIDVNYSLNYLVFLEKNISEDIAWIHHPIFWRGVIDGRVNGDILNLVYNTYLNQYEHYINLYPDVLDSLEKLNSKNINLYLVANGNPERLYKLIDKFRLDLYFKDFLISGEAPFQKPSDIMFNFFIKKDGLIPGSVIMVGDKYDNDIIGAKKNGLLTCIIKRKKNILPAESIMANPDFTIYNLSSLLKIISQINSQTIHLPYKTLGQDKKIDTAVILTGGKGSRLGDLGKHVNKGMLKVNGIPILEHIIDKFKNVGVSKFILIVSHLSEQIMNYFGDGSQFSIQIRYIEGSFPSTADAVKNSLEFVNNDFYYCHGNIIFQNSLLTQITNDYLTNNKSVISCLNEKNKITHIRVEGTENGIISKASKVVEGTTKLPLTFAGLAIYQKNPLQENLQGNTMTEEFIMKAIGNGKEIRYTINSGYYFHIETEQDYKELEFFL